MHNKSIKETLSSLNTSKTGLEKSQVEKLQAQFGKNELVADKKKSKFIMFLAQLKDFMIIVLFLAAVVSGVIAIVEHNYLDLVDSGLILLIILVNAIVGVVQESKADSALQYLKNLSKPYVKVMRNGTFEKILIEELTIGDLVLLEAGDIVPADLRLVESVSLRLDESTLTGESVPVEKDANKTLSQDTALGDRVNMAFSTSTVVYGHGMGVVVAIGMNTEVGKIASMLNKAPQTKTPLQKQINKTAKIITYAIIAIAIAIFATSLIYDGVGLGNILSAFMLSIAIAVAAIPEGMPAIITVILSLGIKNMSQKKAIVKNLPSVETLGCCEVICSDKTGTLTLNQMTVKTFFTLSGSLRTEKIKKDENSKHLFNCMLLCNDSTQKDGKFFGDPTEVALLEFCKKCGKNFVQEQQTKKRLFELPFDSDRKMMTTTNLVDGKKVSYTKGAVDILLEKCTYVFDGTSTRKITTYDKRRIMNANKKMTSKALRVLGFACKIEPKGNKNLENGMIFVGLAGMIDPPREMVAESVAKCKKAGIVPIMITGDHLATAKAIASEIGIYTKGDLCITGKELDLLSDEEFMQKIEKIKVYARVSPENKVRIVTTYKNKGKVVAMTGDGVNDAPSIKAANIGIGMGISGTDVSKEAADVILTDDNFVTIVTAVEEGRKVYNNIRKAIKYLLCTNIVEVLCIFIATVILKIPILSPIMILWINLITDSLPAIALGLEKTDTNVMNEPPRKTNKSLFAGRTGIDIIFHSLVQAALILTVFCVGAYVLKDTKGAMSMVFVSLSLIQLFHAFNCKSKRSLLSSNPFANLLLDLSFAIGTVSLLLINFVPIFMKAFGIRVLSGIEWAISIGVTFAVIPIIEIYKLIANAIEKRKMHKKDG